MVTRKPTQEKPDLATKAGAAIAIPVPSVADVVVAKLFQSAGVTYYALHCCDCTNPHWGTLASNDPNLVIHQCDGSQTSVPTEQSVTLPGPFALASTGVYQTMSLGYTPIHSGLQLLSISPGVHFINHGNSSLYDRKFQLMIFGLETTDPCDNTQTVSYKFAVADRCQTLSEGDILINRSFVRNQVFVPTASSTQQLSLLGANIYHSSSSGVDIVPLLILTLS